MLLLLGGLAVSGCGVPFLLEVGDSLRNPAGPLDVSFLVFQATCVIVVDDMKEHDDGTNAHVSTGYSSLRVFTSEPGVVRKYLQRPRSGGLNVSLHVRGWTSKGGVE